MKTYRLILASASPARLKTLENAGLSPEVHPADVDEAALLADLRAAGTPPAGQVLGLARAKAQKIASDLAAGTLDSSRPATVDTDVMPGVPGDAAVGKAPKSGEFSEEPGMAPHEAAARPSPADRPTLVIGCDSMLEFGGEVLGKPHSPEVARERVRALSGASGVLHTGHWVVLLGSFSRGASPESVGATESTVVHFEEFTPREIEAYVATGEPLEVAGSFTIDGRGGAFIRGIEGDPHNVVGISLPCLRRLLGELGVFWPDLWV